MSKIDPHPAIRRTAEGDGNSSAHIDPARFRTHQSAKFILHSPRERTALLEELAGVIGAADGTTLRQKSELLELEREMRRTHQQLCALKR
jgi:hypothetical protein